MFDFSLYSSKPWFEQKLHKSSFRRKFKHTLSSFKMKETNFKIDHLPRCVKIFNLGAPHCNWKLLNHHWQWPWKTGSGHWDMILVIACHPVPDPFIGIALTSAPPTFVISIKLYECPVMLNLIPPFFTLATLHQVQIHNHITKLYNIS